MDIRVRLAKKSLEHFINTGEKLGVSEDLAKELLEDRAACFVTLYKDDELRGCIGTILPTKASLAEEIIENAVSAGTRDTRFPKVTKDELKDLAYSVDVLTEPEEIESMDELDPSKYGVIVTSGFKRGLLLPDLDGVDDVETQVSIAINKARIFADEDYKMERFKVIRYV